MVTACPQFLRPSAARTRKASAHALFCVCASCNVQQPAKSIANKRLRAQILGSSTDFCVLSLLLSQISALVQQLRICIRELPRGSGLLWNISFLHELCRIFTRIRSVSYKKHKIQRRKKSRNRQGCLKSGSKRLP
jgi:hypothetical protein